MNHHKTDRQTVARFAAMTVTDVHHLQEGQAFD
jgi:hypothetical protein